MPTLQFLMLKGSGSLSPSYIAILDIKYTMDAYNNEKYLVGHRFAKSQQTMTNQLF
jgi:hypothetical protein